VGRVIAGIVLLTGITAIVMNRRFVPLPARKGSANSTQVKVSRVFAVIVGAFLAVVGLLGLFGTDFRTLFG
jgi:hypothetical protein